MFYVLRSKRPSQYLIDFIYIPCFSLPCFCISSFVSNVIPHVGHLNSGNQFTSLLTYRIISNMCTSTHNSLGLNFNPHTPFNFPDPLETQILTRAKSLYSLGRRLSNQLYIRSRRICHIRDIHRDLSSRRRDHKYSIFRVLSQRPIHQRDKILSMRAKELKSKR